MSVRIFYLSHNRNVILMKKYNTLLLIIGFAALLLTQQKVVMPLIYDVIKSDFFLVDSKDQASQLPISTHLTDLAFMHCNKYIASKFDTNSSVTFAEKPINSWSLGNYQYVINAEANVTENSKIPSVKKYVCRITYKNGDDQNGIENFDNWTINGVSGLDNL